MPDNKKGGQLWRAREVFRRRGKGPPPNKRGITQKIIPANLEGKRKLPPFINAEKTVLHEEIFNQEGKKKKKGKKRPKNIDCTSVRRWSNFGRRKKKGILLCREGGETTAQKRGRLLAIPGKKKKKKRKKMTKFNRRSASGEGESAWGKGKARILQEGALPTFFWPGN